MALPLTPRHRDILELLALGKTNRQIAEDLGLSHKTVNIHVQNMQMRLGLTARELIVYAVRETSKTKINNDHEA